MVGPMLNSQSHKSVQEKLPKHDTRRLRHNMSSCVGMVLSSCAPHLESVQGQDAVASL